MIKHGNNRIIAIDKTELAEGDALVIPAGKPDGLLELKKYGGRAGSAACG